VAVEANHESDQATPTENSTKEVLKNELEVFVDSRKFSEYIFKEDADHGKDKIFKSLGYGKQH
jgi:hypothetical protein